MGRDRNQSPELMGNSTDGVARLMEAWLSRVYPSLEVIRVHSLSNLFRYDENIAFVNHELLPKIEAVRDELARDARRGIHVLLCRRRAARRAHVRSGLALSGPATTSALPPAVCR